MHTSFSKILLGCMLLALVSSAFASIDITTLSTRPDSVTGGDVLVQINYSASSAFPFLLTLSGSEQKSSSHHGSVPGTLTVTLNGTDVTSSFQSGSVPGTWLGLVKGLQIGNNKLRARASTPTGNAIPGQDADILIVNHPISGPVFSGQHEQPFYCMTQNFKIPGSTTTLGAALDSDCSTTTRTDYVYQNKSGAFVAFPSASTTYPADMAYTTTTEAKTVPYIVRVETGTINRGIYQTAVLHDPTKESAPTPYSPPSAWNGRLVYTLGGGCPGGWYIQGSSLGNSNGVLEDLELRQGYAVASNTLNTFGNNCSDVLAAETLMMTKERFIKNLGRPALTIGLGCSAGAEQAQPVADIYPGLLDGIIVGCSWAEPTAALMFPSVESALFSNYLSNRTKLPWTDDQVLAATGEPSTMALYHLGNNIGVLVRAVQADGSSCNAAIPVATRYDPITNPTGVRCDFFDHNVNTFGRDPKTGFARRTFDNVGLQYGLLALNAGQITKEQFLDLNSNIGGYDNNGSFVTSRSEGDLAAIKAAYQKGRIVYGGDGMRHTPIIDYRAYIDFGPNTGAEPHQRMQSFIMRDRLLEANGNFDNQIMLIEDLTYGLMSDNSPVLQHALNQMDQWVTNLLADQSNARPRVKLNRAKPADLVDACFTTDGTTSDGKKIAETQVYSGNTSCNLLYPSHASPRMIAGGPLAHNVLKCRLKPIDTNDYTVAFTADELAKLKAIFPDGVCDWNKPGVLQQPPVSTWPFSPSDKESDGHREDRR